MYWLREHDLSEEQTRSVVAGMRLMSAVDGVEDPQEQALINVLLDGLGVSVCLIYHYSQTLKSKVLTPYDICCDCDTTINDAECTLIQEYIDELKSSDSPRTIDHVARFWIKYFADSNVSSMDAQIAEDLRLGMLRSRFTELTYFKRKIQYDW